MRDDFKEDTKRMLANRAGTKCSNPACQCSTVGPRTGDHQSVSIGVAAHIHAASPGGTRYDAHMDSNERSHIQNGIWLCQSCAKLIDNDEERYPARLLRQWKSNAETIAIRNLEQRNVMVNETMAPESEASVPTVCIKLSPQFTLDMPLADFERIITRLAVSAAKGERLALQVVFPDLEKLVALETDEVKQIRRRQAWLEKAEKIAGAIQSLCSEETQDLLSHFVVDGTDRLNIATAILLWHASGLLAQGTKLDVWRTTNPQLSAPIYLSKEEVDAVLLKLNVNSLQHLAFGAGCTSAYELPNGIIISKVLPRIFIEIQNRNVPTSELKQVLALESWHVGLG